MFLLLPVALVFSAAAVGAFIWATRAGQFDDLETPGHRILHEDQPPASGAAASPTAHGEARALPPDGAAH